MAKSVAVGDKFIIKREKKKVFAKGYKLSKGGQFMVKAGSTISNELTLSLPAIAREVRKLCEDEGIIVNCKFTKDHPFHSWSLAASVILGFSASGPREWKRTE